MSVIPRIWSATIFVTKDKQEDLLKDFEQCRLQAKDAIKYYLIGGPEIAPSTGGRHVHALVQFKFQKPLSAVKKLFSRIDAHWTPKEENITITTLTAHHCKLETKEDPTVLVLFEYPAPKIKPTKSKDPKEDKYKICIQLARDGNLAELEDRYPAMYINKLGTWNTLASQQQPLAAQAPKEHLWIHGPPRQGKTTWVEVNYPEHYKYNLGSKFWNGYDNQDVVLLDDMDPDALKTITVQGLKMLGDDTPFPIDIKYKGGQLIRPRVIITSNFTIEEVLTDCGKNHSTTTDIQIEAIKARFTEVHVHKFLHNQGLKFVGPDEVKRLKESGNTDKGMLFKVLFEGDSLREPNYSADMYSQPSDDHPVMPVKKRKCDSDTSSVPAGFKKFKEQFVTKKMFINDGSSIASSQTDL